MKCKDCREKIASLLMEDLPADERTLVEEHLKLCQGCRQERDMLAATLEQLAAVEDVPVPHHFFIRPEPRLGLLQLFSRLSPLWKGAVAAAALVLLAGSALGLSGFQMRVQEGTLTAGFGSLPSPPPAGLDRQQAEALFADWLQVVDRRIEQQDEVLTAALLQRVSELQADLGADQQERFETLLADFEQRLARRWQQRDLHLQAGVRDFVEASYGEMQSRYRQDLSGLGRQLQEFAARDDMQDRRIALVSDAFLKIVEGTE